MVSLNKNLELIVAREASKDPAMDSAASKVEAAVKAAAPKSTGNYKESIKTKTVVTPRGVKDRVVYSDDPFASYIEWGGLDKNGKFYAGHFTFNGVKEAFKG